MIKEIIIGAVIFVILLIVVCLIIRSKRVAGIYRIYSGTTPVGDFISFGPNTAANHYYVLKKDKTGAYIHPIKGISGLVWKKKGRKIYMSQDGFSWSYYNKNGKMLIAYDEVIGTRYFKKSK